MLKGPNPLEYIGYLLVTDNTSGTYASVFKKNGNLNNISHISAYGHVVRLQDQIRSLQFLFPRLFFCLGRPWQGWVTQKLARVAVRINAPPDPKFVAGGKERSARLQKPNSSAWATADRQAGAGAGDESHQIWTALGFEPRFRLFPEGR